MTPTPTLLALLASAATVACAPRPVLCTTSCGNPDLSCVAGECLQEGRELEVGATDRFGELQARRMIVEPVDLALLQPGEVHPVQAPIGVLGRARDSGAMLLARFAVDLPPGTTVIEAHLLLDRAPAVDPDPETFTLRAARIAGAWDSRSIGWARAARVEELDAPRTPIVATTRTARIDVRPLVRRWRNHPKDDLGIAVLADRPSATGMAFALEDGAGSDHDAVRGPRLELYVKP